MIPQPASPEPLLVRPFPRPLLPGVLVARYNRFLAEVLLDDGNTVHAHCVNTGRMETLTTPGLRVWVSHEPSTTRQLQYTWQLAELDGILIGTNTAAPNQLVRELLEHRRLPGMTTWKEMRPEYRINAHSRCDFWMREARGQHYVEVKNCHLVYPDRRGYFPDSVSERAAKHLRELSELVSAGHKATVLFVVQRADARSVRPSDAHDPAFAAAAREAQSAGVRFRAILVRPTVEALIVERLIPADIKPYATTRTDRWRAANRALAPAWETRKPAG